MGLHSAQHSHGNSWEEASAEEERLVEFVREMAELSGGIRKASKGNRVTGFEPMWNTCALDWDHDVYPATPFNFHIIIVFVIVITASFADGTGLSINCSLKLLKGGYWSRCSLPGVTLRSHHYSWPANDLLSQDTACPWSCPHKRVGERTNTSAIWEMWP